MAEPTKKILNALERVFAAEIEGRLPFQSKALVYLDLQDKGLVEPMQRTFGGRFPVTVSGWQLTELGRILYCSSCDAPTETLITVNVSITGESNGADQG